MSCVTVLFHTDDIIWLEDDYKREKRHEKNIQSNEEVTLIKV